MSDPDSRHSAHNGERPPTLFRRLAQLLRGGSTAAAMRESLEEVIEESERQNLELSGPERTMLANLLKFGELTVRDVMVPRADIVAVEENASLERLIAVFREAQHSRLPVYRETLDDPTGVVHIKDVLALLSSRDDDASRTHETPIPGIKREVLFVPPSMPLPDLLLKMQTVHMHLALVVDEYGGTDGLVTIEDVIEEIVGDIADEHDQEEPHIRRLDDGSLVADARMDLESFKAESRIALASDEAAENVDTLGGLIVSELGRVPVRGEIVTLPSGFDLEVLEADPRRVRRVRVRPPAPSVVAADEAAGG